MSLLDYQGRKFDLLALRGAKPAGKALLSQTLFGPDSAGELCVGIQKLAQRWVLEFLTEVGSMTFRKTRGCEFMRAVRTGRIRTENDVQTEFEFANLDIRRNLVNEEYAGMPDDERFDRAELPAFAILPGYLQLTVAIYSVAGDSRKIILPVETTV